MAIKLSTTGDVDDTEGHSFGNNVNETADSDD